MVNTVKPMCEMSSHSIIKMSIHQTTPAMKLYIRDTIRYEMLF